MASARTLGPLAAQAGGSLALGRRNASGAQRCSFAGVVAREAPQPCLRRKAIGPSSKGQRLPVHVCADMRATGEAVGGVCLTCAGFSLGKHGP